MSNENENVNDINAPVQTNETPGDESEVVSSGVKTGEKSDESSTNVSASFNCEECGEKFNSRQDLKEHTQVH